MEDLDHLRKELDKSLTFFQFEKAKSLAKKGYSIAIKDKKEDLAFYFQAQIFIIDQDYKKAIPFLDNVLEISPQDSFALNDKGVCLAELGFLDDALSCLGRAIEFNPDYPGFYQNKGWLFTLKKEFSKALICFYKALELSPHRADTLFSIGYCFKQKKDKDKARVYYLRALKKAEDKSCLAYKIIVDKIKQL